MSRAGSVDLEALARSDAQSSVTPPRRRWVFWLVPVVLAAGFLAVFYDTARDLLVPATKVTTVRPIAATDAAPVAGSIVFQAAGWVEPDPYPIRVTALAEGVVSRMLVQEADKVSRGDVVCELVAEDAEIAFNIAEAALIRTRADLELARVEERNARESFAAAIDVTQALGVARAESDGRARDVDRRVADVAEAGAAVTVAEQDLATRNFLRQRDAVGPWQVELAAAKLQEARAHVAALKAEQGRAVAEAVKAKAKLRKAERDMELRLVETLRVEKAAAALVRATAAVTHAEATLEEARLRRSRMRVVAPADGVVLIRDAAVGSVVGPAASASAVCHLYDPGKLRVRVDVPQGQVSRASAGQRAEIRCDARRGKPYQGRVLRIVDAADIQKVTLEVQVAFLDPDDLVKPDMLCQVTVFGAEDSSSPTPVASAVRIPHRCVVSGDSVWLIDVTTGRAMRRRVKLGQRSGDTVVVLEGLNVTDRVIDGGTSALTEGDRVEEGAGS